MRCNTSGIASAPIASSSTPIRRPQYRTGQLPRQSVFLGICVVLSPVCAAVHKSRDSLHALVTVSCRGLKGKARSSAWCTLDAWWTDSCASAFAGNKDALTNAPVLSFADYRLPFIVETDASDLGLGAVLNQVQEGRTRIIVYASGSLSKSDTNSSNYSSISWSCWR